MKRYGEAVHSSGMIGMPKTLRSPAVREPPSEISLNVQTEQKFVVDAEGLDSNLELG